MGENLKKFQHQQWGSVGGYANEIHLAVLKDEVEVLKTRIEPHDTGHIHTTISTLSHRIEELQSEEITEEDKKDAVSSLLNMTRNPDDDEKYDYPKSEDEDAMQGKFWPEES